MTPRIALIHAVFVAIEPIAAAMRELWPQARPMNLLDDALSPDRERSEALDPLLGERIVGLAAYAVSANADAILYTCSAFGPAIDVAKRRFRVPVLKPNEAMFELALEAGNRIGMVATFEPSVASMEDEFAQMARERGVSARLTTRVAAGAMAALKSGEVERHNALVAAEAARLDDCDAILLAHFSTSRAYESASAATSRPVLTSPRSAVLALRSRLAAQ
ncbi:MAG: aspartate/glutamate racemase family protein [Burkholderiales bacterium]